MNQEKLTEYNWWGEDNEPPQHLKTKKQLTQLKLKPLKPVGVIYTRKYDLYLYDVNDFNSVRPKKKATESQLKALAKGREAMRKKAFYKEWEPDYGRHLKVRNEASEWAKEKFKEKDNWVILDTETTGLEEAEIIQIGIINLDGQIILESLIKPTIPISIEAEKVHGITEHKLKDAPSFPEIYEQIVKALESKQVLIYNSDFDTRLILDSCKLNNLKPLNLKKISSCLMEEYAKFYGQWSNYYQDYKWQSLNGEHNAISDCKAALSLLKEMANFEKIDLKAAFEKKWQSL